MDILTRLLLNTDGFDAKLSKSKKSVNSFTGELGSIATKAIPGIAAFAGISLAVGDAARTTMTFEKSLSSLKALTGVSTQELSFFKEEAIRLGSTTTQTAAQVADAYKLIGSQMPELLKNKEALSRVTEQAIVLAEAAEIDVPSAAKALTGSLNQMGESSMRASSYINILAAASQQGSADIPYLNKAIENAGGTAAAVGIKFNQLVAAVEAVAPKITDAGSAGTNLRNIFLTLESSTDRNLRPSVVGLSKALENLSAKKLNATQMAKMFGKESVTAALALVKEKDTYIELERSITDTNTAYEQQRINNDNLSGSIKNIQSAWEGLILSVNQSSGILKDTVNIFAEAITNARLLMLTKEQLKNMEHSKESKTDVDELNTRIAKRVNKGETKEQALDNELKNINNVYPEAMAYQTRLNALKEAEADHEKAKLVNINGYAREEAKAVGEARKLFELSEHEYFMRNAVIQSIKSQQKELQIIADSPTGKTADTDEAAAEKARKAELKRRKEVFEKNEISWNSEAWAKQEALGNTIFKRPLEQPLKIIPLPISTEEIIEEALPQSELEIKLKAKLENAEYAKKKIAELKELMEVATTPEEKKQLSGQIGEWKNFGGIVDDTDIENNMRYAESLNMVSNSLGMVANTMGASSDSFIGYAANSLGSIAQMIIQLQALATAQGVASAFELPFPANLAAAAMVVGTVASLFSSLPKLADGGIAYGNSVVNVGEYAGASGNPEVIAPLSKLREYIQPREGSNTLGGKVVFTVSGTSLKGVLSNVERKYKKFS